MEECTDSGDRPDAGRKNEASIGQTEISFWALLLSLSYFWLFLSTNQGGTGCVQYDEMSFRHRNNTERHAGALEWS